MKLQQRKITSCPIFERLYIFILLCSLGILFTSSASWPLSTTYPKDCNRVRGKVKFMAIYDFNYQRDSFGNESAILVDKSQVSFYTSGNVIVTDLFGKNNSRMTEYICTFNETGRMKEMTIGEYALKKTGVSRYDHKYDSQGRELESTEYDSGDTMPREIQSYTYINNGAKTVRKSRSNSLGEKNIYMCKAQIDTLYYDAWLQYETLFPFSYKDSDIYKVRTEIRNDNKVVAVYNKRKEVVRSEYYDGKKNFRRRSVSSFDKYDNVISTKSFTHDSIIHSEEHHYLYDKIGNWTTDSIFENDKLSRIMIRRYEYY